MIFYLKLGKTRAMSAEFKKDFGSKPLFEKKSFHRETIIDIPYAQFVYTPSNWFPRREAANGNNKIRQTGKSLKRAHKD